MGRKPASDSLCVRMNGREVGTLTRERSGALSFAYAADWLGWKHAMPVSRSVPLREEIYRGSAIFYVLDNLLPDGVETRRRIADRVKAEGLEPFHLLAKIGRDCVGALQFFPEDIPPSPPGQVDVEAIDDGRIGAILRNLNRVPLGLSDDEGFRISIAGAQGKTALTMVDGQWCLPRDSTATTHILKPAIGVLPNGWDFSRSVENEWFCLGLLRRFGLTTPNADIRQFDGETALVIERFDRRWTPDGRLLRVPQEDLLQAIGLPRTQKYEVDGGPTLAEVIGVLRSSDHPDEDGAALFKAKILYWLLAATDCHAKNASLFIRPQGGFRLRRAEGLAGRPLRCPRRTRLLWLARDRRHFCGISAD